MFCVHGWNEVNMEVESLELRNKNAHFLGVSATVINLHEINESAMLKIGLRCTHTHQGTT